MLFRGALFRSPTRSNPMGAQSAASAPVAAATSEEDASGCSLAERSVAQNQVGNSARRDAGPCETAKSIKAALKPDTRDHGLDGRNRAVLFAPVPNARRKYDHSWSGPMGLVSCAPDQSIAQQRLRPPLSQSGMANPSLESGALQAPTPAVGANPAGEAPNLTICVLSSPVRSRRSWPTWA